jgi:hypothetical protein
VSFFLMFCLMKAYARFYRRHLGSCIGFEIAADTR